LMKSTDLEVSTGRRLAKTGYGRSQTPVSALALKPVAEPQGGSSPPMEPENRRSGAFLKAEAAARGVEWEE